MQSGYEQSSLSSIEVGFSLCPASKHLLPFSMTHASEYPSLTGWTFAALRGILGIGQSTGHFTITSIPWLACDFDKASSSRMLRSPFVSPIVQILSTTQKARPNQAHQWAWFLWGILEAIPCSVVLCSSRGSILYHPYRYPLPGSALVG